MISLHFAAKVCDTTKSNNLIILALGNAGGFRQLSNNKHPIKSPADLKGLKIRTTGMQTIDLTYKALGASTVSTPYNDLYMSLKTGVVDGQENPWINVVGMKFYEVQKYFTVINYQFQPDPFYVNLQWYNSLPADYQKIVKTAAVNMMKINDDAIDKNEIQALNTIKKSADVYTPSAAELQQFKDATKSVYDEYIKLGKITKDELATMQDIVAKSK
jgi:C4-dicarboxylate-binding protein DctP